jgi:hypothetical protein
MLWGSGAAGARIATEEDSMKRSTILRTSIVGGLCAIAGAAAGIAGSSASSSPAPHPRIGPGGLGFLKHGPLAGASGPPVHVDAVLPKQGGGFETVTMDRGSFSSLSANQLAINEGTKTATYKTVTLTIPAGAVVRRNGVPAQLSDLRSGDLLTVIQSPASTAVVAHDAQHEPRFQPGLLRRHELRRRGYGQLPSPLSPPPAGGGASEAAPGAQVGPGA